MSNPLTANPDAFALRLDHFESGSFSRVANGWVHRKTIPDTIVAQATEGLYEVRTPDRHIALPPGGIFVVPANTPVEITHHDGPNGIITAHWMHFRFSVFDLMDFLSWYDLPLQLPEPQRTAMSELLLQSQETNNLPPHHPARILRQNELASRALSCICQSATLKDGTGVQSIQSQRLAPVLQFIKQNLPTPLSVDLLAKVAHLSPAQFFVVFKSEFGVTPMKYVRGVRLEAASRLLANGDATLAEIATQVGFVDAFHLSHAFKAHFGTSPRDYRRQATTYKSLAA